MASSSGPSAYIPTIGAVASATDLYRMVGLAAIKNKPASRAMTDTDSLAALGRIVDGPIRGGSDLVAAENALRALLLTEYVEVYIPCFKRGLNEAHRGYERLDGDQRNKAAFECLRVAPSRDSMFAMDQLEVNDGRIIATLRNDHRLIGLTTNELNGEYRRLLLETADFASAYAVDLSCGTYFSSDELLHPLNGGQNGFIDRMYKSISNQWGEFAQPTPTLYAELKLPPLLAIVLTRAPHRKDIPRVLSELRDEFADARLELTRLNSMLDSVDSQAEIVAQSNRADESFDAIVAESLLTDVERRRRRIGQVFNFLRPAVQITSIALDAHSFDPEKFFELFQSAQKAVRSSARIVSRNVAAATLAEFLRVDSIRELITTHFDESELKKLMRSEKRIK